MQNKPNVIYVLTDDLGYGDVSALNEKAAFQTPHLDRLAKEGLVFSDAHATSAVCTPSRYGILTGRYNWRSELKSGVLGGYSPPLIEEDLMTVADLFKQNGYQTACIGKWHLGMQFATDDSFTLMPDFEACPGVDYSGEIQRSPLSNGFDYYYGISASLDMAPYVYIENNHFTALPDRETQNTGKKFWRKGPTAPDFEHEKVLPQLTDKVLEKIEEYHDQPFFIYFPMPAPHTPILPSEEFQGKSGTNEYGDFVLMVDAMVKRIDERLKALDLNDNTIVVFTSDNGCSPMADFEELAAYGHNPSYIFRGHKADIYEGGHRIPLLIRWPEGIKSGRRSEHVVCLSDFMATMAELLAAPLPGHAGVDSVSNLPIWLDEKALPVREDVVHQSIDGSLSIRQGRYKLALCPGSGGWSFPKPGEDKGLPSFQLFDMQDDVSERENLIEQLPEIAKAMKQRLKAYILNGRSTPGEPQKNSGDALWDTISWMEQAETGPSTAAGSED